MDNQKASQGSLSTEAIEVRPRKICVVITARPSYSRIKSALTAIKAHKALELQLVIAGSALLDRYGNAIDFIKNDGFEIAEKVFMVLEGENPTAMAKTTGLGVLELANVFYNLQPDAVITIADRFETIATSIAAAYQNIPLIHIQGGEVTGNIDEKTRHANTKFADLHLVSSEDARKRVIKMGEDPEAVINTGCPSIDLARMVLKNPSLDFDPIKKYGGVGADIDWKNGYMVAMQHPETNRYESAKKDITATIEAVHKSGIPTFWFWPNVDSGADGTSNGIRAYREKYQPENIHFFKNMDGTDFLKLLKNSKCLIGNSSAGIRECSFLGVPVINIGKRQNRRMRGSNVMDIDYSSDEIFNAIKSRSQAPHFKQENLYGDGFSGQRIADVIATRPLTYFKTITY